MFTQKSVFEVKTTSGHIHRYECDADTPLTEILQVFDYMHKTVKDKLQEMEHKQNEEEVTEETSEVKEHEEAGI